MLVFYSLISVREGAANNDVAMEGVAPSNRGTLIYIDVDCYTLYIDHVSLT